jgi:eukaryotic-like serine/threonine-protein kinase
VLVEVEQSGGDARVWFETEYGMGEVLFHRGLMVKARLGGARGQTALLRLIAITEGRYGVEDCSIVDEAAIVQNVNSLIELHHAREAEWKNLCSSAPPLSSVLRLTSSGADVRDSSRGIQRVILVLIDGRRTLMQVLEESSFDPVEALKIVTKAIDDDLAQIAPQSVSLFPLAPVGETSGVLPRFVASTPMPRVDPASPSTEGGPPSWRHATLVGLGMRQAAGRQPGSDLAPAPIIDIGRRASGAYAGDAKRAPEVHSMVKTVIQSFGLGKRASSARIAGSAEAPRQRIVDIAEDASSRHHDSSAGEMSPLSGEYPADASGPKAGGQRRYIDRYEILLRIGRGGMGTVYLARLSSGNVGFSRLYAVKLLRSHLSLDTQAAKDFLEEARIAGNLHHANVVSVHDAGFHGKQPYLVMEYIEGCSLSQLTQGLSNRSPYFILPIAIDALAGLQAAHALQNDMGVDLNLVHCDVSPENMLVGVDGTCRLTDFGMARKANRTFGSPAQGKAGYVSPEQISGKTFDHRADIFSMGVVLWGALTGKRLFAGDTVEETVAQVCSKVIVPPSMLGAQVSRELDEVVMRALARQPSDRFESAEEMLTALGKVATNHGGLATPKEIASWVREVAGNELTQRRLAILDASRNNPTIPPPSVESPPVAETSVGTGADAGRPYASREVRFSSGRKPTAIPETQAAEESAFAKSSTHREASAAESSDAPPRSEMDVSLLFYGKDDISSRPPRSLTPVRVAAVSKSKAPRQPPKFQFRITKPWLLVILLAMVVGTLIAILVRTR